MYMYIYTYLIYICKKNMFLGHRIVVQVQKAAVAVVILVSRVIRLLPVKHVVEKVPLHR